MNAQAPGPSPLPRVLLIGDATAPSGFSRVVRSIFEPLATRYDIHHLATRYRGDPHGYPWKLYPAHTGGDPRGLGRLRSLAEALRPDLVFIVFDIPSQVRFLEVLRSLPDPPPVVAYSPIESGPLAPERIEGLSPLARHVLYTEHARGEVEAAWAEVSKRRGGLAAPRTCVVPHGVDVDTFRPLPGLVRDDRTLAGRRQVRRLVFPGHEDLDDAFIVLNANHNQPRKRIDVTLKGFALFSRGKPESVRLCLHMGVEDRGWHLLQMARRLGIEDRLILTGTGEFQTTLSEENLNLLYNACDVGLNTASGEGWGMVSFEHAATGAAQVVPRHGSLVELWDGAARWVLPVLSLTDPDTLEEAHVVSPVGVAQALEDLYAHPEKRRRLAEAAYRNACRPEYRWNAIAERWDRLFGEVLTESRSARTARAVAI